MDKETKIKDEELIEYIKREQSCLIYREVSGASIFYLPDKKLTGIEIKNYIANNPYLLTQISNSNLVLLYDCLGENSNSLVEAEIIKRVQKGERVFAGSKIDNELFFVYEKNANVFTKINKQINLTDKINADFQELKQTFPRAFEFISKANSYLTCEAFLEQYDKGNITAEVLDTLEKIIEDYPRKIDSINFGICEPEVIDMNFDFLKRVSRYKNKSTELIIIYEDNPELFKIIKDKINEWENTLSEKEASNLEAIVLNNCAIYCKDMHGVDENDIENIINYCIQNEKSSSPIKIHFSKEYDKEYIEECDKLFEKDDLDNKLNAYCMKYMGSSYKELVKVYNRKMGNINLETLQDKLLKDYILEIKELMEINLDNDDNVETLTNKYYSQEKRFKPKDFLHFTECANQEILQTYEQEFIDTQYRLNTSTEKSTIYYNEKPVTIINVPKKFQLIVRSTDTGFKADKKIENSFREAEQDDNPSVYLKSGCLINENFTGVAPLGDNGTYFVFINNNKENIGEIGNSDLNSNVANYGVTSSQAKSVELKDFNDNVRRIYAEATIYSREPDAIMLFDDATEIQQQMAYKAAAEYDVPVILMEKEIIMNRQVENINSLIQQFKNCNDIGVLQNLISIYESNVAGWLLNRDTSIKDETCTQKIDNSKYISKFNKVENDIYKAIAEYCNIQAKKTHGKENIIQVAEILLKESSKYEEIANNKCLTKVKQKFKSKEILQIINRKYDLNLDLEDIKEERK